MGHAEYDFSGESAIVTGSTKGIGHGIAKALVEAGANVVVNSRTESDVEAVVTTLGDAGPGDVIGIQADVSDPDAVESLVDGAVDAFGTVDLLVNNAAVWPQEESMVDASLEDWNYTIDVNVRSQFYASKLVAQHMIEEGVEGSIVNITSQTGDRRAGGRGLYGVSNTAINGLTWRMAHDLAEHGICMNAVSTAATDSHQLRKEISADLGEGQTVEAALEDLGDRMPIGRLGEPVDLADGVLFLASDRARYVVGTILRVSGGGNLQ